MIRQFSIPVHHFQGNDGSLAVLTVLEDKLDADLNYYDPDILLHIENCGRGRWENKNEIEVFICY